MKFKFNKEDDVLMIEFNSKQIDYAEQSGDIIVHFSPKDEVVLMEILNASKFLKAQSEVLPKEVRRTLFASSTAN